jgi:hypothetical protein
VFTVGVASASPASDKAAAQKLLTQGNQLTGDGDYLAALEKFRAAYRLFPSPKILLNMATTLRQLGRNVEAAEVYETYLADPGADPARVALARRSLVEIDAVLGKITIQVNLPDAKLHLDGKELTTFKNGDTLRVDPGDHTIVADGGGFPTAVATVHVKQGLALPVALRLAPREKQTVFVEGPQRTIAWVVGGVGLAGLAAGGVAGALAIAKNNAAASHCGPSSAGKPEVCDSTGFSLGNTAKTSATVSTVALAAGGAALATGVVIYLTVPKPRDERAPSAAPATPTPGAPTARLMAGPRRVALEVSW